MQRATVLQCFTRGRDRTRHFIQDRHALQRQFLRCHNGKRCIRKRTLGAFKGVKVRKGVGDARTHGLTRHNKVQGVVLLQLRDGQHQIARILVVNIFVITIIRGDILHVVAHLNRQHRTIRTDNFRHLEFAFAKSLLVIKRNVMQFLGALFREGLHPPFNPKRARTIRRVHHITRLRIG